MTPPRRQRAPGRRTQDLAAALAFLAAAVLGTHYFLRSRNLYGPTWSDGDQRFRSSAGESVRHAVWGAPEPLLTDEAAHDPALSPDGQWVVFVVGERGLNAELFASAIEDGRAGQPERLGLCSAADELAPAFGPGWLYFASDRPGGAGGLDLWRAPYEGGLFGAAEPIEPGVNSPADETDPAFCEREGDALYLASNRPRGLREDFALYRALPEAGHYALERLEALDSPFDEREPSLAPDGRALLFASDRSGGSGGFDLWRSVHPELDSRRPWGDPAPLRELSTELDERGPYLSPEGFALLFEGRDEANAPVLLRARSHELLLLPPPPVSMAEWLLFVGLLLASILALLARRWRPLDILYKCVLVSLLLHLLLMLFLRTVTPQSDPRPFGRDEGGPSYRVRLAPAETGIAQAGGPRRALETQPEAPQRERFESGEPPALEAALEARAEPAAAPVSWPERESAVADAPAFASVSPVLALHEAPLERYGAAAPRLPLPAAAGDAARPTAFENEPLRPTTTDVETPALAPILAERLVPRAAPDAPQAAPQRQALRPATLEPVVLTLATPSERLAPASGAPAALALPEARPGASIPAGLPEMLPERAPLEVASAVRVGPLAPTPISLAAPAAREAPLPSPVRVTATLPSRSVPELRVADEALSPTTAARAPAFDALAASEASEASEAAPRREPLSPRLPERLAGPEARGEPALRAPERSLAVPTSIAAAAPALERTRAPLPEAQTPQLRAPEEAERRPATPVERPVFDALGGPLDERERPRPEVPSGPSRAALAQVPTAVPVPEPVHTAWTAPANEWPEVPVPDRDSPRIERSAYQNRFGDQKLRALEEFGGTQETERAVAQGLLYLAAIQERDGAWGERSDGHDKYQDVRIGKTGLALLAFLGAGHLPARAGRHADTVDGAVRFLLAAQRSNGHFGDCGPYGHGIATYALAEAFALTRDENLRAPVERAVARIVATQARASDPRRNGGWGYFFADDHVWNRDTWPRTSVTAWQVMALESARLSNLAVPDETFAAAREFLLGTWDERARAFRYDHDPARLSSGYPILPASTPAALFALSLLGLEAAGPELEAARRFVLTRKPDGYRYTGDDDFVQRARGNLYFWYYGTLAMFRVGGKAWDGWNGAMKDTLLPAQRRDGSWAPLDIYGEYAGDEDDESAYTTALCVLSLEVYYRYFTPLLQVR